MSETQRGARPFGHATASVAAICAGLLIGALWTYTQESGEIVPATWVYLSVYAIGGQVTAAVIWRSRTATWKGRLFIALVGALFLVLGYRVDEAFEEWTRARLYPSLSFMLVGIPPNTLIWGLMASLVYEVAALGRRVFSRGDSASVLATPDDVPGDPIEPRGIFGTNSRSGRWR